MSFFYVKPNGPLNGDVTVSGAKNAVLPIMCACMLTDEVCRISSVPPLIDVFRLKEILENMGAVIEYNTKSKDAQDSFLPGYASRALARRNTALFKSSSLSTYAILT